jgi:biotin transport system substrate-specific component
MASVAVKEMRVAEPRAFSVPAMVFFALCGAALTGLLAQVRLPLPFTPVPLTGQVLAVLICGALLGGGYGLLSQVLYVSLGVAGVPWFAGATFGGAALLGVTGGYLIGFMVAAFFLGAFTRVFSAYSLRGQLALMLAAVAIIHVLGLQWLMAVTGCGLTRGIFLAVAPFLVIDVLKAVLAALITSALLPRTREI